MLSKKSYFKPALFWDDLRRFSPIWVCASLLILLIPCSLFLDHRYYIQAIALNPSSTYFSTLNVPSQLQSSLLSFVTNAGPGFALIYAGVCAMALLAYLYQSRSALGIHALPISRVELFVTHFVAGLAMAVLPLVVFAVTTLPMLASIDCFFPLTVLQSCLVLLLLFVFFFSFALFCGMFTGQLWGLPLFYGIFNALACISYMICYSLANFFLYGFSANTHTEDFIMRLTPVWQLTEALDYNRDSITALYHLEGTATVACYAVIGLVFAAAALKLFTLRQLERAGEIVCVKGVRTLFVVCLSVYGGFCTMLLLCSMFSVYALPWMLLFLLLGTLLGFCIGQMLLEKTIAIISLRNLKRFGCTLAVCCVALLCIYYDLLGYETYLPEADKVASATITAPVNVGSLELDKQTFTLESGAELELLYAVHSALLADFAENDDTDSYSPYLYFSTSELEEVTVHQDADGNEFTYANVYNYCDITYTLTSGQQVRRSYHMTINEADLARANSPTSTLDALVSEIADPAAILEEQRPFISLTVQDNTTAANTYTQQKDTANDTMIDAIVHDLAEADAPATVMFIDYLNNAQYDVRFYIERPVGKDAANGTYNGVYTEYQYFCLIPTEGSAAQEYAIELLAAALE